MADPPGDNGTVKIDGEPFDPTAPDNEPHVGCVWHVDFYGFDFGQGAKFDATVQFFAQPPSGKKYTQLGPTGTVPIGEDAAGGGTDLDASQAYDLSPYLNSLYFHPNQGYHIKLIVNAPGSIGNDTKSKTYWVQSCNAPS